MFTLNCKGRLIRIDEPLVMGILNVTPDSFYEGSRFSEVNKLLHQAEKMIEDGADLIDIGGQSTRPNSQRVSAEEELNRVIPAIEAIHKDFPETIISIDTFQSRVAAEAVAAGASMVNDVSGGSIDSNMISSIAQLKVPYVCMHMKGDPASMQDNPVYENVTREILDYFILKIAECKAAGIHDIIIDPGFGFGKTATHNFLLLKQLPVFKILEKPILLGASRKSTIYKTLGISVEEALNGTTVLNTLGLLNGVNILRVHDVKEAKQVITLLRNYSNY